MSRFRTLAAAVLLLAALPLRAQLTDLGALQLYECLTTDLCTTDDDFGWALAVGDFNDDGFADLAVGVPGGNVNGITDAGFVHVYYGSRGGLKLVGDQIFDQDSSGIPSAAEEGDDFGLSLAVGDFDGDGFQDLAVGVPLEDLGSTADAGVVDILFGSASGLTGSGALSFSQDTLSSSESAEAGDRFGVSLAAGPQGLGFDVLAIGVPGEDLGIFDTNEGQVDLLASVGGVPMQGLAIRQQVDACDGGGLSEADDHFGWTLGFRRKGSSGEWIAGTPFEDVDGANDAGCVDLIGSNVCWSQGQGLGQDEDLDQFGFAVSSGDFDGDGRQDMAVGTPGEATGQGKVDVLYANGANDIDLTGSELVLRSDPQANSFFGHTLTSGDFDADGHDDLAMATPYRTVSSHAQAGEVSVIYGSTGGFVSAPRWKNFNESSPAGMPGTAQTGGSFGLALAAGDFDGNGTADLAIGAPREDATFTEAGTVTVLYGLDGATGAFGTVAFGASGVTVTEPSSNTAVNIAIGRFGSAVVAASVDYGLVGGTATQGGDFDFTAGTKSWAAGSVAPKLFSVTILPDTLDEGDETIKLSLANPSDGTALGSPRNLIITIQDDDVGGTLKFHQSASSVGEGSGMATIQVDRTGGAASSVTVHYATSNGSATAGLDYTSTSGTLTFAADQTSATFSVPILQDSLVEQAETVTLTLSLPGGGGVLGSPSVATLTIVDDDLFRDGFETGLNVWSAHT